MNYSIRLDALTELLDWEIRNCAELNQTLLLNSQEIIAVLENVGLNDDNITGVVVLADQGSYRAVWLTENNKPYLNACYYHPLPYYLSHSGVNTPYCLQESNEYY